MIHSKLNIIQLRIILICGLFFYDVRSIWFVTEITCLTDLWRQNHGITDPMTSKSWNNRPMTSKSWNNIKIFMLDHYFLGMGKAEIEDLQIWFYFNNLLCIVNIICVYSRNRNYMIDRSMTSKSWNNRSYDVKIME
jgi:hypothetical protein